MINALNGRIVQVTQNSVVVDVMGVEYYAEVSTHAASHFSAHQKDEKVRVLTKLNITEYSTSLYGFMDEAERDCFNQLQTVPGIGAKQALKILSSITVTDFIKALDQRDVSALSRIPGIGAKSAQKLILQLRDTLVYTDDSPSGVENLKSVGKQWNDILESFISMGYDKKVVQRKLDDILKKEASTLATLSHEKAEAYIFPLLLRSLA
ncbi:MAG: Holliday junction branch migration protein RuvA [Spirochaetales bacterium]|nr:Holliday junction branch migration protein RuvA [Spirochaetales bacterium]